MKTIQANGKTYRRIKEPVPCDMGKGGFCDSSMGKWEFLYNGKWHEVRNYSVRIQLDKLVNTISYISDCCDAPVKNVGDDERGICTKCNQECWAADPEMLLPVTLNDLKKYVPKTKQAAA